MNEKRMQIWIVVGGLALVALLLLLLLAGNVLADNPAALPHVAALQDGTSWSSGWVDIAPGETRTFTHGLGGDPALYAVDLWFRDTRSPGLGIHDRAYGGMNWAGQHLGAYWHNLTGDSISVTRMGDDVAVAQVRLRIWIPEPFDYDSGWVDIQAGQMITLTHNLGGDVDDYTVGIKFRDTSGGLGIHHYAFGGLEAGGQFQGAAWQNLTNTTIQVLRFGADTAVHQVRVFITRPDPPNYDSGWVSVAQNETRTFPHGLGGNPNGYVVRVSAQSAAVGINMRAAGGLEANSNFYGVTWQNLTGNTINVFRFPNDVFADQVRVRIWVEELPVEPSFLSATLGVGQRVTTTLTINNTGTDPLTFALTEVSGLYTPTLASSLQLRAESGTTQILAWTAYADLTREYPNTIAAITQFYQDFTVTTTATTDPAVLETALADKDVFLVPEMESASSSTISNIATTWVDVLDAFVRRGGTIVVTDYDPRVAAFFEEAELMDVSWMGYATGQTMRVVVPLHPVTEGLSPTFIGENASGYFSTTDGTVLIVHEASGQAYVAVKDIGSGHVVLIASDFYLYNDNMARLVANAVQWSGVPWLDEEPTSGTVLPGEAADVAVTFDASSLTPGTYTADLLVNISDSVSSMVTVPVTMNVTEFGLSPSTKDVDLATANPGDRLTYSIVLANAEATPISAVLSDTIPANTTYVANSVTGGATYNTTEKRIEWSGTVPGDGSHTVTFQVDVNKPLYDHTSILNTALIEDLTNGISHWRQVATDIEAPVLTGSYKQVAPATVQPGGTLTFTVVMCNTGSADAVGATLRDPIPDHATYVPDSVTGGATYNAAEDSIEWSGTIPVGGSQTVTFQVTADQTTKGLPIINKATISHPWAYTTYEYAGAGVLTGADILVVENDYTTTNVRDIYTGTLEANGYARYDFFPADYVGTPPTTTLRSYPVAIWYGGWDKWGLGSADQTAVKDYLGNGGRLLLTGDYIAEGTSPRSFLTDTLHIRFVKEAPSGAKGVAGIAGEILEGISSTIQSYYPNIIEPADPLAVPIIQYTGVATGMAGVRFTEDNSQCVFLGFAFEKVTEQTQREEMMGRIMGWLYRRKVYLPLVLKSYTHQ
jgi:uncharacterized repeat protein (TIGR01451 family)